MKISIITPSLNSVKFIDDAIKSVLSQNYANFEHIIIDAVSTDGTLSILRSYNHLIWLSESDKGQSDALNKGIALATGDIIVLLNADDYFLPNAFRTILPYFEKGESFVVGDVCIIDSQKNKKIIHPKIDLKSMLYHWSGWLKIKENHYLSNFPNNPVQYFYLKSIHNTISYNVNNHLTMDLEFLLDVVRMVKMKKIDAVLGVYRMLDETKTIKAMTNNKLEYWSNDNFSYIDSKLLCLDKEEIIKYKNDQINGYSERLHQEPKYLSKIFTELNLIDKISFKRHPIKKLLGFQRLLSIYRENRI